MREDLRAIADRITDLENLPTAEAYVDRLSAFLAGFDIAPQCGTRLRDGRRRIGFQRRAAILFRVRGDEVLILRVLARGRRTPVE